MWTDQFEKKNYERHFPVKWWPFERLNHWWRRQVQFRSIFDERHELGQEICTNARNTAGLYGLSLSCCFDLIVFITKISKHWEFAPIAWLCLGVRTCHIFCLSSWCSLKTERNWNRWSQIWDYWSLFFFLFELHIDEIFLDKILVE